MRTQAASVTASALLPGIVLFAMLSAFSEGADAQRRERQGKEVVDAVCSECHVPGKEGAPRIGDANAWASRASQGLTALTNHAIKAGYKVIDRLLRHLEQQPTIVRLEKQEGPR